MPYEKGGRSRKMSERSSVEEKRMETHESGVNVDAGDALVGSGNEELALDELLNGKDDAVLAPQPDDGSSVLDGLVGVLDLWRGALVSTSSRTIALPQPACDSGGEESGGGEEGNEPGRYGHRESR
jgi:hypothetical protein